MSLENTEIGDDALRVLMEVGFILREAARFDEAENVFRGLIELIPDSEIPQIALGTVYLQRGNFARAEEICENALDNFPESLYARVYYAEALLFKREREKAESELHKIIEKNPDSPHSQTARALLEAAELIAPKVGI